MRNCLKLQGTQAQHMPLRISLSHLFHINCRKAKSTDDAMLFMSAVASNTTKFAISSGIAVGIAQRPDTASLYVMPAEPGLLQAQ